MVNGPADLQLVAHHEGYDFVLGDEKVGGCTLDGLRLVRFEVDRDQRRRGIGRRAMELILESLPDNVRLAVEIDSANVIGKAFAESLGFGVKGLVLDRRVAPSEETVELFRPVGQTELDLIKDSGWRAFPPRLPDQPIFYPVATLEYARLIAADWNVRDAFSGNVGYVLRFRIKKDFLDRHPPQEAGGRDLIEYWIPAEAVPEVNANLVGEIELLERYPA